MPYAAIIFDLDGTLLDTEAIAMDAGLDAAQSFGLTLDRAFFEGLIGKDGPSVERIIASVAPADFPTVEFKEAWGKSFRDRADAGIPVKPGVNDLLDHLDATGLTRAVATNSSYEGATHSLQRSGLADRVHHVVGRDLVANPKPAPDLYLEAARRLAQQPAACLAFEDSLLGTQAALAAGMTVVHVPDIVKFDDSPAHFLAETLLAGARMAGLDA